jgi:hypothetical protein
MAWTAPRTWVTSEVPGASTFNTDHRDNLIALKSARPVSSTSPVYYVGSTDPTNTTTTFTDSNATEHKITIVPEGTRVRVWFGFMASASGADGEFDILQVSGSRAGDATHGIFRLLVNQSCYVLVSALFTGLTPNTSYDFKLQFRTVTSTNTVKIFNNGYPLYRFAKEE